MEKQGVIRPGLTPPEDEKGQKQAQPQDLEAHATKRAADAAEAAIKKKAQEGRPCNPSR